MALSSAHVHDLVVMPVGARCFNGLRTCQEEQQLMNHSAPARALSAAFAAVCVMAAPGETWAASTAIRLDQAGWETTGDVKFIRMEGFPQGILAIKRGAAVLKGHGFGNGTIEFDARFDPQDMDLPAIRFHRRDADNAEEFYLRPDSDCPAANDCVQYTPVFKGRMTWDMYPEYQAAAPISLTTWNHVRLVIGERRMNVFINGQSAPALSVARLQGEADEGGIEFKGPASFANLTLSDNTEGKPAATDGRSVQEDPRFMRRWLVTEPLASAHEFPAGLDAFPRAAESFAPMTADENGLVNLNRRFGPPTGAPSAFVWLKSTVRSTRAQNKHVAFGWLRQAAVFVNGQQVFKDDNFYYPATARREPDGRLSLENGGFELPLRAGDNEIDVLIGNSFPQSKTHYGWGFKMRFDDLDGIALDGS